MTIIRIAVLAALLSGGLAVDAAAYSYKNIAGKWCGRGYAYTFTRHQLKVTFTDGTPTRRFKIVKYLYPEDMVVIEWIDADGKQVQTQFNEFSADGRHMAQRKNDAGPRRSFHRC